MRTFKRIAAVMQVFIILSTVVLHALPVSADEAKQFYQTVTTALFTDASYSAPLLSETEITLTGEMPKGASVKGYPVSHEIDGMKTIAAYDLTIFESDGETVFQPDHQTVNVTCAIPALADAVPDEIAVFHIDDNGNQTEIADISADSKTVSFAAEHFSVYVISEHEGEEAIVPRIEFHFLSDEFEKPDENYYSASAYPFYNKANELQTSQILRDGESLALIADPPNHVENGVKSYFYGWYVVDEDRDATTDETVYYRWTADPAKIPFEAPASVSYNQQEQTVTCTLGEYTATLPADADGCAHVYLAPLYSDYYFINFYNKDDDNNSPLSLITSKLIAFGSDGEARARIGNITAPSPDIKHKVFVGWKRELPPTAQYDPNDPNIYIDSANNTVYAYYITLDTEGNEIQEPSGLDGYYIDCRLNEVDEHNNISLYPIFAEARWILFQHEPGATYIGSKYILTNDEGAGTSFTSFPVSNKVGYDFNGWFTADGTRITDGNGVLVDHLPMTDEMYQIENGVMTAKKLPDESANSDITLYPRWTVKNDTNYTVNIWLQKSTDAADAAKKTYDYLESHQLTSATGATLAQLLNDNTENGVKQFTNLNFTGFHFEPSASKMERAVTDPSTGEPGLSSDGQTVINLYYDRNEHNLYFQAYLPVTEYTPTTSNKGTQYGYYEGEYVPIYYINKTWYRTRTGSYGNYQYRDKYTGTRYTASTSNQWTTIKTITEIYEHHIADNFPITGSNGVTYGNGERWKAQSVYDEVLVRLETMPDADVTFRLDTAQRPLKTMNYYIECLPGETGDITFEGKAYQLYQSIGARYNMVTELEDFSPIEGFTQYKADPPFVNGKALNDSSRDGTINMYYTRDNGKLLFIPNYPTLDSDLSFGGVPFEDLPDDSDVLLHSPIEKSVKYQASLLNYAEGSPDYVDISDKAPDNYVFSGWYLDSACLNPFDPDVQMPSGNLRLFAKWEPVKFRILIDPNGAEIDHINHAVSDYRTVIWGNGNFPEDSEPIPPFKPGSTYNTSHSTYFDNNYHQTIEEYKLKPPQYITISDEYARQLPEDQVYYYLNMQYKESIDKQKIPRDLRNALYLTENELRDYYDHFYVPLIQAYKAVNPDEYGDLQIVSFGVWKQNYVAPEKYTHITDVTNGEYAFEGWFEVFEDGSVAEMPFDFATLVTSPHKLEAHWKLNGGYTIVYTPLSFTANNDIINGDMEAWQDPSDSRKNYVDKAETTVLRQPDNITLNNQPTKDYIFRGWQIVGVRDADGTPEFYPLEPGVYYQPGEKFHIQAKYADKLNTIHFQAVYEHVGSSYRRPDTSVLILDANGGYLTPLNSDEPLTDDLVLDWTEWYESDSIGTIYSKLKQDDPVTQYDQLHFETFQSNAAVHLYQYATGSAYDPGSDRKPEGGNYFAHEDGYMLLGFDEVPNEGDFIADYTADSVISVQRNDNTTLYAVWEPTVYLNFENKTDKDITFSLTAQDTHTLYIVNQATSLYDRVKLNDLSQITVPAGETLRLAIPYGENKAVTIEGVNQLGVGKLLVTKSYLPGETEPHLTPLKTDNGQPFSYSETLLKDPDGLTIEFTPENSTNVLILEDPADTGRNTGSHEIDFRQSDLDDPFILNETRSSTGYIFAGWSDTPGASEPDYPVTDSSPYQFALLSELFDSPYTTIDPESHAAVRRLYAVWKIHSGARIFRVYKDAPPPGKPDMEYAFTVDLYAPYTYRYNMYTYSGTVTGSEAFVLKNGEYLRIENDVETGRSPHIQLVVQRFGRNDQAIGDPVIITQALPSRASAGINLTNENYKVTVTEQGYANFDTGVSILALEDPDSYPAYIDGSRSFYWTDPNAGGTVLYTNTRKTADVTLAKLLVDPENTEPGKLFRFKAELLDTDSDYEYTLSGNDSDIALINGESYTLKDLPVNAKLRITELAALDHNVSVLSENGSADLHEDPRVFEFIIPESGETITYTNELRSINVVLHSVDEYGAPFADATYQVSGGTDVYPDTATGIFYRKEPMYLGDFTVDQIWCDPIYQKISETMHFSVVGTDDMTVNGGTAITSDLPQERYSTSFDPDTQTWHIYIINMEKEIAPTGVTQTPASAAAMTAVFSFMFCTAFVYINRRRKGVERYDA